uniref:ATP synthase F0 subunit 8 n=1 Tax=Ditylenchus dipsaci TaxID=166011 RepID=A0A915EFS4_9BILA
MMLSWWCKCPNYLVVQKRRSIALTGGYVPSVDAFISSPAADYSLNLLLWFTAGLVVMWLLLMVKNFVFGRRKKQTKVK